MPIFVIISAIAAILSTVGAMMTMGAVMAVGAITTIGAIISTAGAMMTMGAVMTTSAIITTGAIITAGAVMTMGAMMTMGAIILSAGAIITTGAATLVGVLTITPLLGSIFAALSSVAGSIAGTVVVGFQAGIGIAAAGSAFVVPQAAVMGARVPSVIGQVIGGAAGTWIGTAVPALNVGKEVPALTDTQIDRRKISGLEAHL